MYKSKMFLIQALYRRVKEGGGEYDFMGAPGSSESTFKKKKPEQPEQSTLTRPSANTQTQQASQPQQSSQSPDMRQFEHLGGDTRGEPTTREKFRHHLDKRAAEKERMVRDVHATSEKFKSANIAKQTEKRLYIAKNRDAKTGELLKTLDSEAFGVGEKTKEDIKHKLKKKGLRAKRLVARVEQRREAMQKGATAETSYKVPTSPGEQAAQKALNAPGGSTQPATKTTPAMTTAPDGNKTPTVAPMLDSIKDWFKKPEVAKYAKPIAGLAGVAGLAYAGRAAWKAYKNRFDAAGRGRLQDMDQSQSVMASDRAFTTTEQAYRNLMERYY